MSGEKKGNVLTAIVNWIGGIFTTKENEANRNAIFGFITFVLAWVYIFFIKPGDSVTFGIMLVAAGGMLGLSIKEDKGTK